MNLLIVDDEYYTVESISNKIRTLRPDFFEIFLCLQSDAGIGSLFPRIRLI